MTWRRDDFPLSAQRLPAREPRLAARLVGWSDSAPAQLMTADVDGRFWLWRWERSEFVNRVGERERDGGCHGEIWLWVPLFGPWSPLRMASADDLMIATLMVLGEDPGD